MITFEAWLMVVNLTSSGRILISKAPRCFIAEACQKMVLLIGVGHNHLSFNPEKLEKPCIAKGLATCQSLGLIFSCNKVLTVDPVDEQNTLQDTVRTC